MFKKILIALCTTVAATYLLLAITAFNRKPVGQTCPGLELVIRDSVYAGFVTSQDVSALLRHQGLDPAGKNTDSIDTRRMEQALAEHPLIDAVECYKTPGGQVCVEVSQRLPILRILSDNGENYYVDSKGRTMPLSAKCVARLPVVTGHVSRDFATGPLYGFGLFLYYNPFWQAQTEQIHILPDQTVELVPRVGNHLIYLGKLQDYDRKLRRVKLFYEKALHRVGWNKYSRLNVEFEHQVICTKR